MTRLSYSSIQVFYRRAKRNFKAKCGHNIKKGQWYLVVNDYAMYQLYHWSKCSDCVLQQNPRTLARRLKIENAGTWLMVSAPKPLVVLKLFSLVGGEKK